MSLSSFFGNWEWERDSLSSVDPPWAGHPFPWPPLEDTEPMFPDEGMKGSRSSSGIPTHPWSWVGNIWESEVAELPKPLQIPTQPPAEFPKNFGAQFKGDPAHTRGGGV